MKARASVAAESLTRDQQLWRALQGSHLRLADQVEFSEQIQRGQLWVVVHDPVRNLSYKTTPEIHQLLSALNGQLTLREILAHRPELAAIFADPSAALNTLAQLLEAGLLLGDFHYDYAEEIVKHRDKQRTLGRLRWQRPWMLKLPLFNPNAPLTWLYRKTWFIWTRAGLVVWLFTVLVAAILLLDHISHLQQFWSARFLDPVNLALLLVVYPCLKALHEIAHGLTTKKWGGQVYEVGLMFLVFMPVPYVDASASARFTGKYSRMLVAASGVMTELFCAAIALFIWLASDSVLVRDICMNVMIIGAISSVLFNGNPLLRFDGYYVLSDALEIPNLSTRANLYLKSRWQKMVLGVEPIKLTLAPGEKKWLLLYGVLSGSYRLVLSFIIAFYIAGHYFFVGVLLGVWALILQMVLPLYKGLSGTFASAKTHGKQRRVAIAPPTGATTWRDQEAQPEVVANFQEDELRQEPAPSVAMSAADQKRSGARASKPQAQQRHKVQSVADQLKREQGAIVINSYGKDARHAREALDRGNMLRNQLIEEGIAPARVRVEFQESASRADVELVHAPQAPVVGERAGAEEAQTPVGESHFQSNAPITVAPGTSALISVLDKRAEGDVVYVYDPHGERGHKRFAFRAVRLINPTRYTLETGPVTVYGEERFIGEGLTEPIAPGATAMIPFALDRQIIIEPTHRTGDRISRLSSVERGIMRTEVQYERRTSYKVSSLRRDATSVFIKHDVKRGWKLVEHPTLHERSGESHLFEVKLDPQETKTVEIVESTPLVKTFDLRAPASIELVSLYLESAQVDPRFRASMDGLLKLHRELANLTQQMEVIRSRITEYRTRMIELEDQLVTLGALPNAKTLLSHLQQKLKEISARVQADTIALVDCEQQIMMARVRFQDGLSELTLERPAANTAAAANAPTGTGG